MPVDAQASYLLIAHRSLLASQSSIHHHPDSFYYQRKLLYTSPHPDTVQHPIHPIQSTIAYGATSVSDGIITDLARCHLYKIKPFYSKRINLSIPILILILIKLACTVNTTILIGLVRVGGLRQGDTKLLREL